MTLVLLAIGLLVTAVGFVTIGFGIPINAFSLGNTLILTGAIAVATGLLLIAIAVAVGQLKRIVEALDGRTSPRAARIPESVETLAQQNARMAPAAPVPSSPARQPLAPMQEMREPHADLHEPELPHFESHRGHDAPYVPEVPRPPEPPRAPEPPRPRDMPRPPDRRPAEPRFPITGNEQRPGPLDWLRAKPKPAAAPSGPSDPVDTPPMDDAPDEAPPFRLPPRQAAPAAPEPIAPPPHVEQPMPRATPQPEPAKDHEGFDLVWPDRAAAASPSEPLKRASDMPLPPIPARPRDNRPPERRPEAPAKPAERGPAILKSGVIDGMPYTLYADGSIEAELPQGTVKFASVDALRSHLERQG